MTRRINKIVLIITSFTLFIIPLIFSYYDFVAVFEDPRLFTLHLSAILIIILSLWKLYYISLKDKTLFTRIKTWDLFTWGRKELHNWMIVIIVLYSIIYLFSAILSPITHVSIFGGDDARSGNNLYDYLSFLTILFTVIFYFNKFDKLLVLLYVLVISAIIAATYGIAQYFGWDPIGKNTDQIRILASFGNTLNFSGYMVMAIPATIVLANMLFEKNKYLSILFIIGLGLEISGLWLSAGRGPWIGALFGMIIFFTVCSFTVSKKNILRYFIFMIIGILITVIISSIPTDRSDVSGRRILGITEQIQFPTGSQNSTDSTDIEGGISGRLSIWNSSIKIITQAKTPAQEPNYMSLLRVLFGVGPDMYVYSYPLTSSPSSKLSMVDHAHNYLLQTMVEVGLLGLLAILTLGLLIFITSIQLIAKIKNHFYNSRIAFISLGIISALGGKLVDIQAGVPRISDTTMMFALIGAIICINRLLVIKTNNETEIRDKIIPNKSESEYFSFGILLSSITITILLINLFFSWDIRRISASYYLASVVTDSSSTQLDKAVAWETAQEMAPERDSIIEPVFDAHVNVSLEQYSLGNIDIAINQMIYGRSLLLEYEKRDPYAIDIQIGLAKSATRLVEWGLTEYTDEMVYRYDKLARNFPGYPSLLGSAATALASVGLFEEAIIYADMAIETEKTTKPWSKAWYAKGASLASIGKINEGIEALNTATIKEPNDDGAILAHQTLSEIYAYLGEYDKSEKHAKLGDKSLFGGW